MTKEDKLILEPANEHKKLSDILANFEEKYILAEFDWGEPVGHEKLFHLQFLTDFI